MTGHRISGSIVLLLTVLLLCAFSVPASVAGWEPLPLSGGKVQVAVALGDSSVGRTWHFVGLGPNWLQSQILGIDLHDPERLYIVATDPNSYRGFFCSDCST